MASKSLKERLANQKKELKSRSEFGLIRGIKADTTIRVRPLPVGEEKDFGMEVSYVFMNKDLGGFVSPSTFGKKCAFSIKAEEMAKSKKDADRNFAKARLAPKKKFLVPCLLYKDIGGKEADRVILLQLTSSIYQDMIDLFLDDAEAGDFTNALEGYDLKFTREGSTMTDTKYSVRICKPTKLPKEFRKVVDLEEMVKGETASYQDTKEKLEKFMGSTNIEDTDRKGEEDRKERLASRKKKKRKSDL